MNKLRKSFGNLASLIIVIANENWANELSEITDELIHVNRKECVDEKVTRPYDVQAAVPDVLTSVSLHSVLITINKLKWYLSGF